jgi:hypothetical protein
LDEKVEIPDTTEIGEETKNKPWPIREQPHGMQMRFKPYGFDTGAPVTTGKETKKDKKRSHEHGSEKKSHKKKKASS